MSYEMTAKLVEKFDTQEVTASFKKREFVVEKKEEASGREFIETIKFQLSQDRCDLIDPFNVNEEVKVHFNIKGRRWEKDGRVSYFTNLEAWRLEKMSADAPQDAPPQHSAADIPPEIEGVDDLPF